MENPQDICSSEKESSRFFIQSINQGHMRSNDGVDNVRADAGASAEDCYYQGKERLADQFPNNRV
jgi:hypothetical protein